MTITALSKELGVSTPTIYRRLKACNVNIADLRDGNQLTQHGVSVISALFDASSNESDVNHEALHEAPQNEAVKIASLTAQVNGLQALVAQLEGERDDLRRQLATVSAALEREQADRQHERILLGSPDARRGHWWQRLFHN